MFKPGLSCALAVWIHLHSTYLVPHGSKVNPTVPVKLPQETQGQHRWKAEWMCLVISTANSVQWALHGLQGERKVTVTAHGQTRGFQNVIWYFYC